MKKLVVVESPNKVKKIQSFLDELNKSSNSSDEYKVISSVGHIRELATSGKYGLGIDLEQMDPVYKIPRAKSPTIKEIQKEAKDATIVYLATDPDREGESIAWHVKEIIEDNSKDFERIVFNEITKDAVLKAIESPAKLNIDLIQSQEARRMLDRMIGFRLSSLTRKKISAKSSGRVKSSTLKMIIDRENEIEKFVPTIWFNLEAEYKKNQVLKYVDKKYSEIKVDERKDLEDILTKLDPNNFKLVDQKSTKSLIKPPTPLEMATLLMRGYSSLGYSNSAITSLSQSLYEKGYITYPRTDSTRISSTSFINETQQFIKKNTSSSFNEIKVVKKNKNDQDAHEAIRPTDPNMDPYKNTFSNLNARELNLYKLIWRLTIQSYMDMSETTTTKYIYDNNGYLFAISTSFTSKKGFKELDEPAKAIDEFKALPILKVKKEKIQIIEHSTKPPARYNQSSLIKKMKEEGVGRPSTYSATTTGLIKYNYIEQIDGKLIPTDMGKEVTKLLQVSFADLIDEKYTSKLEEDLDSISIGEVNHKEFLHEFWDVFEKRVEVADETIEKKLPEFVGRTCPECGGELVYRVSRYGSKFIACLNFPSCKYSESLEPKQIEYVGEKCPECGSELVYRTSKRRNQKFIGCEKFPKCRYVRALKPKKS